MLTLSIKQYRVFDTVEKAVVLFSAYVKCADRDPVFYTPLTVGKAAGSTLGDQLQPMIVL